MSLPIFYALDTESKNPRNLIFEGEEAHHMIRSFRIRVGDKILGGDGDGTLYGLTISKIGKDSVIGNIHWVKKVDQERPRICLYQAVSESRKMEEAIRSAAETGIASVFTFIPKRSCKDREKILGKLERWKKIAKEASKVARRAWALDVDFIENPLSDLASGKEEGISFVFWEEETEKSFTNSLPEVAPFRVDIIIGPEGGFSSEEVRRFKEVGCMSVLLGDLILRTESAGSYAAMLVRHHYGLLERGDLRIWQNTHPSR